METAGDKTQKQVVPRSLLQSLFHEPSVCINTPFSPQLHIDVVVFLKLFLILLMF